MESQNIRNTSSDDKGKGPEKNPRRVDETQSEGKKRKPKSVCEYFERIKDKEGNIKAKCSHCSQVYDADSNVNKASMNRHSAECMLNPNNLKDVNSEDEETQKIRKALAKMIIIDELPFLFVEGEGFKGLMEAMCPTFSIPSWSTVARDCYVYYLKRKMKLKRLFKKNNQRVSLTVNIWTSEETLDYMCLTAQFIDDDWTLHNKIINFKPVLSDDGDEIGRTVIECLEEWEIKNVLTITMDEASYNDAAISFLKSKLPNLVSDGKYLHMRSMTRIINLVVKEGLKSQNDTIERIRSAVRYVIISPERFASCVEKNLKSKTLALDFPDRWDSTYDMLERASEFEKAFHLFGIRDPDFKDDLENNVPSRIDWIYARKFAALLEFLKSKTTTMSSTTYVVANQFFSEVMDIDSRLHELSDEKDPRFKHMAATMRGRFGNYWGDQKKSHMLMYFAVILDPRMKLEVIKYGFTAIYNLKKEGNAEQEAVDKMVEDMVKDVVDEFGLLFNEYENSMAHRASTVDTTMELQRYLKGATIHSVGEFDILQWWKLNASRYPTLSKMAKDILGIPLSTVATESAFYMDERVLDSYRSTLPARMIEGLICTHDWVRKSRKDVVVEDFANPDGF